MRRHQKNFVSCKKPNVRRIPSFLGVDNYEKLSATFLELYLDEIREATAWLDDSGEFFAQSQVRILS